MTISYDDLTGWLLDGYDNATQDAAYFQRTIMERNQHLAAIINFMLELEYPNQTRTFTAEELTEIAAKYAIEETVSPDGRSVTFRLKEISDPTIGTLLNGKQDNN